MEEIVYTHQNDQLKKLFKEREEWSNEMKKVSKRIKIKEPRFNEEVKKILNKNNAIYSFIHNN